MLLSGCKKDSTPVDPNVVTTIPSIQSLSADKLVIMYGNEDHAIITCNASGGNLKYTWEVDLGDIIPQNTDRSKVSYTGAACCVGEKTINCTVSNDKGSASKTIIITILENIIVPDIISIGVDKTEIKADGVDAANLVCYAIGGKLNYKWETDCGNLTPVPDDSTRITFTATNQCIGDKTIKCTVSNEKGNVSKTQVITVVAK
jgi:PKD repeat protein